MHQNVAIAEAIVVSCFRRSIRRNRVVYEEGNFPSVRYLYQAQPELDVVVVPDDEAIVEAIDERTLLVPITHVLFKTAEIQDVAAIVRRAHEVGAHVVLDAYQSAGIVPLDVMALNVDFAVGGSVKWLCGGPGNGWLYVRPDLAAVLEPTLPAGRRTRAVRFRAGARLCRRRRALPHRHAERPAPPCRDSRLRPDRGDRRRSHPRQLCQADRAPDRSARRGGLRGRQPRDPARRGGTVTVRTPEFEAVHKELSERQILCDFRPMPAYGSGRTTTTPTTSFASPSHRSRRSSKRRVRAPSRRDGALLARGSLVRGSLAN
jgi:kynureninase